MHFATTITFRAGLFKALLTHVRLQACQLFGDGFDSLSESEIIPFSGISMSEPESQRFTAWLTVLLCSGENIIRRSAVNKFNDEEPTGLTLLIIQKHLCGD
ncbi:hypothetical protein ACH50_14555 [Franconibacter pulveris]|uniref:Uncharacterized protein n=1 Tax=Franconibacter pulveris TaxID=435910 RepID=A0A0J8Y952_9ENTR|nr:hypothetical protein ACH50_14555 [Franconibacter pulveris]